MKSNKKAFLREIPDESDINNFDFDFVDLFNVNRLSGNDRFDSSTRIDYGLSFLKKKLSKMIILHLLKLDKAINLLKINTWKIILV